MALENGDRVLLARIDERLENLCRDFNAWRLNVVTTEQCELRQRRHDDTGALNRMERISRTAALLAVAVAVLFAVFKHG